LTLSLVNPLILLSVAEDRNLVIEQVPLPVFPAANT
jgi:hypothetical protein